MRKLTIRSGHGIGKSSTFAMLNFWFLFTRRFAQIACTAPTSHLLKVVLFKEISTWHAKLKKISPKIADGFEVTELC